MSSAVGFSAATDDILRTLGRPGRAYFGALIGLAAVLAFAVYAFLHQLRVGLGVAGYQHPTLWAIYITNFVFWIGITHSGTLISAVLFLFRARWRTGVARASEAMTVFAIMTGALFPILHLGRPWLFYWLLPFPNERQLWVNFRSPIIWDLFAILTYLTVSIVFLYVGLLPDIATGRDRVRDWRRGIYRVLSLGWSGSDRQWRHYLSLYGFLAALAVPLAVSVHSVVSWDFAVTLVPGWHSTIFAPYFVAGAIFSGVAMIIVLLVPMRTRLGLTSATHSGLYYRACAGRSPCVCSRKGCTMPNDQDVAAYIGLDWGDRQHAVQLQPAAGGPVEALALEQRPHVLHGWVAQLRDRFGGRPVGIAIEQRRGAVIHALMQYEFLVLYPVNPTALARYRQAFHPSGAKDDPTDAALLLDLLRKHRDQLRPWRPDTVTARKLQLLSEHRRKLVNLRGGLTNRLTSLLKQYFPQALDWVGALDSRQACDFLVKWPTLAAVQRARPATVRRFYQQHNCRRAPVIDTRLDQMATAQPLTTDPAIVDTLSLAVQTYATQLRSLLEAIDTFEGQIAAVFAAHPDHELFASFPGAGAVCAPRLAAAFGTDRTRWAAASELQAHAGIAPVTERSGKALWVHHRLACPKFLKQTFHEYADQSIRFSTWARRYYDQQRGRGNDHHAALRSLAFTWMRILFRCWQDRTPYDEARYLDVLRRHGSPLVKDLA